jgi:hypothetical protein
MPRGYNTIVANYGDIATSKLYFEVPRYINEMDVAAELTTIKAVVAFDKQTAEDFDIEVDNRKPMFGNEEKYLLCWNIPAKITCNNEYYTGTFSLSLKFEILEEDDITPQKRWITSTFNKLSIGSSLVEQDIIEYASREEDIVIQIIDKYLDDRDFIISNDE